MARTNFDIPSPVEIATLHWRRRALLFLLALLVLILLAALYVYCRLHVNRPVDYGDVREHFKYGSIGSEQGHLPYLIWKVLPTVFPEHLPQDHPGEGYARFGFTYEPAKELPIGFSMRRVQGLDMVGLNCAACHVGTVRASPDAPAMLVMGMPTARLDLLSYFRFLFRCADDETFTEAKLLPAIEK